jgi:hypothetical protein
MGNQLNSKQLTLFEDVGASTKNIDLPSPITIPNLTNKLKDPFKKDREVERLNHGLIASDLWHDSRKNITFDQKLSRMGHFFKDVNWLQEEISKRLGGKIINVQGEIEKNKDKIESLQSREKMELTVPVQIPKITKDFTFAPEDYGIYLKLEIFKSSPIAFNVSAAFFLP